MPKREEKRRGVVFSYLILFMQEREERETHKISYAR